MKKISLILLTILLSSCSSHKVVSEKECKFVCLSEFRDYDGMEDTHCLCQLKPTDIKK
jgi:hypothetical protein